MLRDGKYTMEAILALVGILGMGLGSGVTYFIHSRLAKQQRIADEKNRKRELTQAVNVRPIEQLRTMVAAISGFSADLGRPMPGSMTNATASEFFRLIAMGEVAAIELKHEALKETIDGIRVQFGEIAVHEKGNEAIYQQLIAKIASLSEAVSDLERELINAG